MPARNAENYVLPLTYRLAVLSCSKTGYGLRVTGYGLRLTLIRGLRPNLESEACEPGPVGRDCEPFFRDWSTIGAVQQ
jgi:hypothetical protein